MARCNCGILPLIAADPESAITISGTGTSGDPLVIGNRRAAMGMVVYADPGNFVWDQDDHPGVKMVHVRAVGGGGGSAGVTAGAGVGIARGGGAGGNYAEAWIDVNTLGGPVAVTVGAGGVGGAIANGDGGDGGPSIFDFVTATGGRGSFGSAAPAAGYVVADGAQPNAGTVGELPMLGGSGDPGVQFSGTQRQGGAGGAGAVYGTRNYPTMNLGTGQAGRRWGGGASGPAAFNGAFPGSAGASGIVLVEMFR